MKKMLSVGHRTTNMYMALVNTYTWGDGRGRSLHVYTHGDTNREANTQTHKLTRHTYTERNTDTHIQTQKVIQIQPVTDTLRHSHTPTRIHTHRDTQNHSQTHKPTHTKFSRVLSFYLQVHPC